MRYLLRQRPVGTRSPYRRSFWFGRADLDICRLRAAGPVWAGRRPVSVVVMLEVNGVSKRFGGIQALNGLSFNARSGAITGFLGPNGAGKTTAMRLIMGIERVDTGFVRWNQLPISYRARRRIGYLPEERGLYPRMRVDEQLIFFARLRGLTSTAAHAQAERWIDALALTKHKLRRTDELSLGAQQRLQLAVALVHKPELLLLDEPFSGVDPIGVDLMATALRSAADDGAAVVFSSHQLELVEQFCDDVTILNAGRAVVRGSVEHLRTHGPRRLLIKSQPTLSGDWYQSREGVQLEAVRDGVTILNVLPQLDANELVIAIAKEADIQQFRELQPTLPELFRAAVAAEDGQPDTRLPGAQRAVPDDARVQRAAGWDPLQAAGESVQPDEELDDIIGGAR
jgi:ABC-2 type transport system ATP-binding protein